MKKHFLISMIAALAAIAVACSSDGWSVKGTIANAPENAKVAVEGLNAGIWYNIDSVEVAKDGSFEYRSPQGSPVPDIYRVSMDGKCIYFPIDSLETVVITTDAKTFDTGYTLDGSDLARQMMEVDRRIAGVVAAKGQAAAATDSVLKREIGIIINEDQSGVLAYYLVNKTIGDRPLFATDNRADVRVLGSIANKFQTLFPNDPRTAYLKERYLRARAEVNPTVHTLSAAETGLFDMELYDDKGKKQRLSDCAGSANATVLNFISYALENAPAYNMALNEIYAKYKDRGVKIYQVSIDDDEVMWRNSATNLPWITVIAAGEADRLLNSYNVGAVPMTFIIDGNGDIVERVAGDPAKISTALAKHL